MAWAAFAALVASVFMPRRGIGFSLCLTSSLLGRPCPLCGLTRSVTCISHLDFAQALHYHPLGFLVYGIMIGLSVFLLVPAEGTTRLRAWLTTSWVDWLPASAFLTVLFGYGLWRFFWGVCP